jgi:bifunctional non-homologous end joining protein LigD
VTRSPPPFKRRLQLRGPAWRTTPIAVGRDEVDALYRVALGWRIEGLVAKRLASAYEPGRRSPSWLKMKWPWARDVVAFRAQLAARYP